MPKMKYHVILPLEERALLLNLISKGDSKTKVIMHAHVLLSADENNPEGKQSIRKIAELFHITLQTVHTIRKNYVENGLDSALYRKTRETPVRKIKVTGDLEAKVIALSCSVPPEGYSKWTLRLLRDQVIELGYVKNISHTTLGTLLKKRTQSASSQRRCSCADSNL